MRETLQNYIDGMKLPMVSQRFLEEDEALLAVALEREKKKAKFISHEKALKKQ